MDDDKKRRKQQVAGHLYGLGLIFIVVTIGLSATWVWATAVSAFICLGVGWLATRDD